MSTQRGSFGLPSTSLGRISAAAFLVGIVLIVLTSTVFQSVSARLGNLNIPGAVNFLVLLVALVTGAISLIKDGERSWAVWLSTGLPALAIGFEILSLLIPGGE